MNAVLRNPNHDDLAIIFYRGFPSLSTVDYRAIEEQQRSFAAVGAMRRSRTHLAAVLGGDGRLAGIVTMEDVLRELFGQPTA